MAPPAKAPRSVAVKTKRDMVAPVLGLCAVTFALAYVVHSEVDTSRSGLPQPGIVSARSPSVPDGGSTDRGAPAKEWTGHLADVVPAAGAPAEPMTSASLVVSPSQLPPVTGPGRTAGKRACEGAPCTKAGAPVPTPPSRPATSGAVPVAANAAPQDRGWPANINPFNHLPDTATLKQPFTYVGDKVAGWFK